MQRSRQRAHVPRDEGRSLNGCSFEEAPSFNIPALFGMAQGPVNLLISLARPSSNTLRGPALGHIAAQLFVRNSLPCIF